MRGAASQPPLRTAALTYLSHSCTEKTPASCHPCKQPGWILFSSLEEEKIKAHEPTTEGTGGTAAACYDLALADLLLGSPRLAPGCALPDEKAQMLSKKFSY